MTSYEQCVKCNAREAFGDGPCNDCKHKAAIAKEEPRLSSFLSLYQNRFG